MEGLENITKEIRKEAEEEREEILEEAKERAEDIKEEGENEAETEKRRITSRGEREVDRMKRRIIANARRKARQNKLQAREEMIQKALDDAREKLVELKDDKEEYNTILKNLIIDAGAAVGGGDLNVLVLEEDEELLSSEDLSDISEKISERAGKDTSLNLEPGLKDAEGGAVVEKADGSISSNNTFEARLKRKKESLRSEVAKILFGS